MECKTYRPDTIADLRIMGRTNGSRDPVVLFWTGSCAEVNVAASELWFEVEADYAMFEPWIDIVIDGELTQRFMLTRGRHRICVFRGMTPSEAKDVRIVRDTQAMPDDPDNYLAILSLSTDGRFCPLPEKQLKMEFIGDSITSGEGGCGRLGEMDWVSGCFDAYHNYARETADALNAEYNVLSQSGWGVHCAWNGNIRQALPLYYGQVCGVLQGERNRRLGAQKDWDFASWRPDLIVINLGTNDNGAFDQPDWTDPDTGEISSMRRNADGTLCAEDLRKFTEDGRAFLGRLRSCNKDSRIIWTYGMLGSEMLPAIREIVNGYREQTGDRNVEVLQLPDAADTGFGSRQHPGRSAHRAAAAVLIGRIREILQSTSAETASIS
jgi:hypothetical protein